MTENPQKTYPRVHIVRLTPGMDRKVRAAAKREKRPMMELWREALTMYLDRDNGHG